MFRKGQGYDQHCYGTDNDGCVEAPAEIGWEPAADTREVFMETMRAKGLVTAPPSRTPEPAPAG
jgi:hypothetical protein